MSCEHRETDSAGVPWHGRDLEAHPFAGDQGDADPALDDALQVWHSATGAVPVGEAAAAVVSGLAEAERVFVPILPIQESTEVDESSGLVVDNSSSMGIAFIASPDGRKTLPMFTSVAALSRWHPEARPTPIEPRRAALAAVQEGAELAVLDAAGPVTFPLSRPALWAIGKAETWTAPWNHPEVHRLLTREVVELLNAPVSSTLSQAASHITDIVCAPGRSAELAVQLTMASGLSKEDLSLLVNHVAQRWSQNPEVLELVDSLELKIQQASV